MTERRVYESAELSVIKFDNEDIVTASYGDPITPDENEGGALPVD